MLKIRDKTKTVSYTEEQVLLYLKNSSKWDYSDKFLNVDE